MSSAAPTKNQHEHEAIPEYCATVTQRCSCGAVRKLVRCTGVSDYRWASWGPWVLRTESERHEHKAVSECSATGTQWCSCGASRKQLRPGVPIPESWWALWGPWAMRTESEPQETTEVR